MPRTPAMLASAIAILALSVGAFRISAAPNEARADNHADARESLLETDRAMSHVFADPEAFAKFLAEDVWLLAPDAPRAQGREVFFEASDTFVAMDLEFGPDFAEVSAAGDFGVTIGTFQMNFPDADGNLVRRTGKYQTTWRRDANGDWKMIVDMFNFDAPMQ